METRISIADFFKLIRWKNLLMIFLTQFIVKVFVIEYINLEDAHGSSFTFKYFLLLSLTSILIAGSGYLINNIIDVDTDKKNDKSFLNDKIIKNKKMLLKLYKVMNIVALIIGFIPAFICDNLYIYLIFPSSIVLLFYYSKKLKSTIIIGNLVVSFLTAVSIFVVPLFQYDFENTITEKMFVLIMIYSIFAFLVNMMREIVKDIEDIEGDFSTGLVTLPIRYGKEIAKKIALLFGVGTLMVIAYFLYPKRYDEVGFYYVLSIGIVLFLIGIISMLFIYKAQTKKDYSRSSLFLKIWMLVGVLSMCFIPKFV